MSFIQGCATSWMKERPANDAKFRYYVGRSYNAVDPDQGLQAARADALIQAVDENYGITMKVQTDTQQSLNAAQMIEQSRQISDTVHVVGFVRIKFNQTENDDYKYDTIALFKYPKDEIKKEREWLKDHPQKSETINFQAPTFTSNSSQAESIDHNDIRATYVFGVGWSGTSATMKDVDNSTSDMRFQAEWRPWRNMGIDTYFQFGGNSITYTNGELKMGENIFGVGLPYYFNGVDRAAWSPFIEPGIEALSTNFSFVDTNGITTSSTAKFQFGPSLNIGAQFRFATWGGGGFSLRPEIGAYYPAAASGTTPELSIQGTILLQWEWFK